MATRRDLLRQLADVADDLAPLGVPSGWRAELRSLCATARLALGAAAVSVARVDDDRGAGSGIVYLASVGPGAEEIEGTRLPAGRGIAGFVAATGQSLAVDRVQDDPRFARDVAESTGYVPASLLVVPISPEGGDPLGVLSVLDREPGAATSSADALELAGAFAEQAAHLLPRVDLLVRLGPVLVRAVAEAVAVDDDDLAAGLRRVAARLPAPDGELATTAALLAELRSRGPETREAAERVLAELLALTAPRRRR